MYFTQKVCGMCRLFLMPFPTGEGEVDSRLGSAFSDFVRTFIYVTFSTITFHLQITQSRVFLLFLCRPISSSVFHHYINRSLYLRVLRATSRGSGTGLALNSSRYCSTARLDLMSVTATTMNRPFSMTKLSLCS
jgi:hypothetical protein